MNEEELYQFYNKYVKLVYSEIEARGNELPVELLFEIHSAFDHLKRYHLGEDSEEEAVGKAYSHLKRGTLDAYKLKLKYFNKDYQKFFDGKTELRIIDSGKFLPKALELRSKIVKTAKEARLAEGQKDVDKAFEYWCKTSTLIDEFETKYFDEKKLTWAKKQGWIQSGRDFIFGIVAGVIGSIIFAFICWLIPVLFA